MVYQNLVVKFSSNITNYQDLSPNKATECKRKTKNIKRSKSCSNGIIDHTTKLNVGKISFDIKAYSKYTAIQRQQRSSVDSNDYIQENFDGYLDWWKNHRYLPVWMYWSTKLLPKFQNWFSLPEFSCWTTFSEYSSSLKFSDYSRFQQNHNSSSILHGEDKLRGLSRESGVIIFSSESSKSTESEIIGSIKSSESSETNYIEKLIENLI